MKLLNRWGAEERQVPSDPNQQIVDDIYAAYPYGAASFSMKSTIQMLIHVVLELKKRGMI